MSKNHPILIVDDSRSVTALLQEEFERHGFRRLTICHSYEEARAAIDAPEAAFTLAVLDLKLPGVAPGAIVDYALKRGIPTIVLTSLFNEEIRQELFKRQIIDYVVKDSPRSVAHTVELVLRVLKNTFIKILVVDDSSSARQYLRQLLEAHHYQVLEARNGAEALALVQREPSVTLVLTDFNMPGMDGVELTRELRTHHDRSDLAIIGMSSLQPESSLSVRFLKYGANDFLHKPFQVEELMCRIGQNVELIETVRSLREALLTMR